MKRHALGILLLLLGLVGCHQQEGTQGELRIGVAQLPMSLDPRFATDAASHKVQQLLHRGLIRLDEHWMPQADVAASWSHPEPLLWVFHLKHHVYFHNGTELTAKDVKATLDSVLRVATASPLRAGFASIASVEAVRPDVLKVHLKKEDASLLTRLTLGILPEAYVQQPVQAHQTIGCGAFRVLSWQGEHLRLQRVQAVSDSNLRVLDFMRVKNAVTRSLKLVRGELDFTQNDLPSELLPYLQRQPNLHIQSHAATTFSYIGLNLHDGILKHVQVREALALAIDRPRLKHALLGNLPKLAETILTPQHWAAARLKPIAFNPQQAEKLLDAAGFPRQQDGMRFHLTYRTSTNATRLRLATAIADMWRQIGVDVSVESMEWGGFYARIKRGDFQVFSLSWVGIADPDIYRWVLHSSMWPPKGANRGRYADAAMDAWLEAAAHHSDVPQRAVIYRKIQHKMHDDMVYIPLWYEPVIAVSNTRLQGFEPTADGSFLGLLHARWM